MPDESQQEQPKPTLKIEYDPATKGYAWGMSGSIPAMELVGFLELIKLNLLTNIAAKSQVQAAQQTIIKPPQGLLR